MKLNDNMSVIYASMTIYILVFFIDIYVYTFCRTKCKCFELGITSMIWTKIIIMIIIVIQSIYLPYYCNHVCYLSGPVNTHKYAQQLQH